MAKVEDEEVRDGESPSPARESRALPGYLAMRVASETNLAAMTIFLQ